ncbi:MAG: hypothetical protein IPQ08_03985 [Chitinophagaceae bacterium]|nr:hypothetical protein [Chitinophagaceae bacterium]
MKARIHPFIITVLALGVVFASCQKDKSPALDYTSESSTHSDDQSRFSSENDAAVNDVDLTMETTSGFFRGDNLQSLICDATIVIDSVSNPRTITITYNGTNCLGNRTRTGVIVISMAQNVRWRNAGAAINLTFQNFKVTRIIDNKSITLNGTQTYTNVSGGLVANLAGLGTITRTITSSNMSLTFDNGSQRNWQVARRRVFTYNNGVVITENGTQTVGSVTNVAEWGTNRFGNAFTTAITQPIVLKQDCSFRVGAGQVVHTTPNFTSSVTFGLDASGNATGCPGANSYYMRVSWTGVNGVTRTVLLPY